MAYIILNEGKATDAEERLQGRNEPAPDMSVKGR